MLPRATEGQKQHINSHLLELGDTAHTNIPNSRLSPCMKLKDISRMGLVASSTHSDDKLRTQAQTLWHCKWLFFLAFEWLICTPSQGWCIEHAISTVFWGLSFLGDLSFPYGRRHLSYSFLRKSCLIRRSCLCENSSFMWENKQSCCYVSCQILHKKICSLFQNICLLDNDSFRARERQKQGDVPADDLLSKWLWWRALANLKPGASSSSSTWGQGPNIWVIFNYFSQTNSHKLDQKRSTQDTNMHLYV